MQEFFPFGQQQPVKPITREEIDAFNIERYRFRTEALPPGKAVGSARPFEALRDASLKLIEAALRERKTELPKVGEDALRRYAQYDDTVW